MQCATADDQKMRSDNRLGDQHSALTMHSPIEVRLVPKANLARPRGKSFHRKHTIGTRVSEYAAFCFEGEAQDRHMSININNNATTQHENFISFLVVIGMSDSDEKPPPLIESDTDSDDTVCCSKDGPGTAM